MKENNAGLKSNLQKVDSHIISQSEYADIPELPNPKYLSVFFPQNSWHIKHYQLL